MTVSYPENFLSRNKRINRQFHSSKRREDEIPHESEDRKRTWLQIQKCVGVRKTQFTGSIRWVRESIVFFQRLLELESSDAPFKDSILSYIDLLEKGFGLLYVSEHSRTLNIDLGVTNAQCTCFEWMIQPLQIIASTAQEGNNYASQLFLFMMRTQLLIHHFCKSFVLRQTLLLIQAWLLKCFLRRTFAKTL